MANPRMTAELGRVLGERYRLIAPIGTGASAQVYLADDERLRRRVALKMLHDALAGDAEFLRRFAAEARAAAALSHPNVMAVYDWGDDEVAYIVTEYLGGGSLRGLLDNGHRLTLSQALTVGLEATRALDYADRRGFVHRDIKPANLLFGDDQRLRIADFGLARALAEAAWTEPQGAMLGTARYAAPEQAKGEHLDAKADVYALALVIIESVTGAVPFTTDTTLGTLMARIDKPLAVPEAMGPLTEILERAGHPDPAQRIDARAFAAGLLRAAKALPRPTPLPLAGAMDADAARLVDKDPTSQRKETPIVAAATAAAAADLTDDDLQLDPPDWVSKAEPHTGEAAAAPLIDPEPEPEAVAVADAPVDPDAADATLDTEGVGILAASSAAVGHDPTPTPPVAPPLGPDDDGDAEEPPEAGRRRRRWPWVVLVLLLVAGAGGVAVANVLQNDPAPSAPAVVLPVPDLVDQAQATAETVADGAGWEVAITTERRDGTLAGQVLATSPAAGTRLARGATLKLTVSAGQTEVDVPTDLVGLSLADAQAALEAAGLEGEAAGEGRFDEDVAEGGVLALAEDTPEKLERGSTVGLVLSKGPEPRTIPDGIVSRPEAEAIEALEALGLEVAVDRTFNDDVDEGIVISQRPPIGTEVARGSTVTIEVSRGPEVVAVPDVSGADSLAEAAAILRDAGLVPGEASGSSEGSPSGTSPGAGTEVRKGATVNIILG